MRRLLVLRLAVMLLMLLLLLVLLEGLADLCSWGLKDQTLGHAA